MDHASLLMTIQGSQESRMRKSGKKVSEITQPFQSFYCIISLEYFEKSHLQDGWVVKSSHVSNHACRIMSDCIEELPLKLDKLSTSMMIIMMLVIMVMIKLST